MTLSILPAYYPDLDTPDSNIAGLAALEGRQYIAANGAHVGEGTDCGPLCRGFNLSGLSGLAEALSGDGSELSGLLPDVLENNRLMYGAGVVGALLGGLHGYARSGRSPSLVSAALWALAGYMAPLPTAGVVAFQQLGLGEDPAVQSVRKAYRSAGWV